MKSATIKDIAAKLSLHHSTVSRALRDHPDISSETKQLVIEAAGLMNYSPNPVAQHLRGKRQTSIAIEVPDLAIPSCRDFVSAMANQCTRREIPLQLIVQAERDQTRTQKLAIAAGVHSLVVWETSVHPSMNAAGIRGCSVLYVGGRTAEKPPEFPSVTCSWSRATQQLMEHLIDSGMRRIGLVTGRDSARTRVIIDAYREALLDAYLPVLSELSLTGAVVTSAGELAAKHMQAQFEKPDVVIITEPAVATGFAQAAGDLPMAVIGDSPAPTVCRVGFPWPDMADTALHLITNKMSAAPPGIDVLPVLLPH